ncbi:MAG: hypothetical protein MJ094_06535 [Saccharofermentans sp.]|nr:hypothetical protein [Saccharofermentans sp.]
MALLGSRKEYSKKDINFFEEFTASARKQAQVLAAVVFVGVIAIGLCLAVLAFNLIRNASVSNEIRNLETTLSSEEYAGLELKSMNLQAEYNDKNMYFYTLTQMRGIIESTPVAETELINLISDCIPSTAYVNEYTLTGNSLSLAGFTFSYYDAANICNLFNESDVFTSIPTLTVARDNTMASQAIDDLDYIDIYYTYQIEGNLTRDCLVTLGYYTYADTGIIALGGIDTSTVANGSTYQYSSIVNRQVGGIDYTLSSVNVNGVAVSAEELNTILSTDSITGLANGNVDISLYYTVSQATEGGEA